MERIMFAAIDIGYYGELPARDDHIVGSKEKVMLLAAGSPARAN
jgi:hypothetical protein